MNKIIPLLLLFVSCNLYILPNDTSSIENRDFLNLYEEYDIPYFEDFQSIRLWVTRNISYANEPIINSNWQRPCETLDILSGDCEDFAILTIYLIYVNLCIDSELVGILTKTKNFHCVVYINDTYYDSTSYSISFENPNIILRYSLIEAINIASFM